MFTLRKFKFSVSTYTNVQVIKTLVCCFRSTVPVGEILELPPMEIVAGGVNGPPTSFARRGCCSKEVAPLDDTATMSLKRAAWRFLRNRHCISFSGSARDAPKLQQGASMCKISHLRLSDSLSFA